MIHKHNHFLWETLPDYVQYVCCLNRLGWIYTFFLRFASFFHSLPNTENSAYPPIELKAVDAPQAVIGEPLKMEDPTAKKVKEAKGGQMLQNVWELKQNEEKGRRASQRGESQIRREKVVKKLNMKL